MRQTAEEESLGDALSVGQLPPWLQGGPPTALLLLALIGAVSLAICLALSGRRRRAQSGLGGRLSVLHAGDEESARVAREVAARMRGLGADASDLGGSDAAGKPGERGVADLTLCLLTPTVFASEQVRAELAAVCRHGAAVIPVHSGDCHPRDDLTPLLSCSAAELVGGEPPEHVGELRRYLFRENIRDVHNSAHERACAATLRQLLIRAAELRSEPEDVPVEFYRHDVFISYHARDSWEVFESVFATLEGLQAKVFNPSKDLQRTRVSAGEMVKHVKGSRCFVQVLSPHYVLSQWCRLELLSAEEAGVPIYVVYAGKKHTQAQLLKLIDTPPNPCGKDASSIVGAQATIRQAVQQHGLRDVYNPDFAEDTAETLEAIVYAEVASVRWYRRLRWAGVVTLVLLLFALCLCAHLALSWNRMQWDCLGGDSEALRRGLRGFSGLFNFSSSPMEQCLERLTAEERFEQAAMNGSQGRVPEIARTVADNYNDRRIVYAGVRAIKDLESCSAEAQSVIYASIRAQAGATDTGVDVLLRAYEALAPCARDRWGWSSLANPCEVMCLVTSAAGHHAQDARVQSRAALVLKNIATARTWAGNASVSRRRDRPVAGADPGGRIRNCTCVAGSIEAVRAAMAHFGNLALHVRGCKTLAALASLVPDALARVRAAKELVETLTRFHLEPDVAFAALQALSQLSAAQPDVQVWLAQSEAAMSAVLAVVNNYPRSEASLRELAERLLARLVSRVPSALRVRGGGGGASEGGGRAGVPQRGALRAIVDATLRPGDGPISNSTLELLVALSARDAALPALEQAGVAQALVATMRAHPVGSSARAVAVLYAAANGGGEAAWGRMFEADVGEAVVRVLRLDNLDGSTRRQGVAVLANLSQVPEFRRQLVADGAIRACVKCLEVLGQQGGGWIPTVASLLLDFAEDPANLAEMVRQGASRQCFALLRACLDAQEADCAAGVWALPLLARFAAAKDAVQIVIAQMIEDGSADTLGRYMQGYLKSEPAQAAALRLVASLVAGGADARNLVTCYPVAAEFLDLAAGRPGDPEAQRGVASLARFFVDFSIRDCGLHALVDVGQAMALYPGDIDLQLDAAHLAKELAPEYPRQVMKALGAGMIDSLRLHGMDERIRSDIFFALSKGTSEYEALRTDKLVEVLSELALTMAAAGRPDTDQVFMRMKAAALYGKLGLRAFLSVDPATNVTSPRPVLDRVTRAMQMLAEDASVQQEGFNLLTAISTERWMGEAIVSAHALPLVLPAASRMCSHVLSGLLLKFVTNLAVFGLCEASLVQAVLVSPAVSGPSCTYYAADENRSSTVLLALGRLTAAGEALRDALVREGLMLALARQQLDLDKGENAGLLISILGRLAKVEGGGSQLVAQNYTEVALRGVRSCGRLARDRRAALALDLLSGLAALAGEAGARNLLVERGAVALLREVFGRGCFPGPSAADVQNEAPAEPPDARHAVASGLALMLLARLAEGALDRPRLLRDGALDLAANLSQAHPGDLNVLRAAVLALHALTQDGLRNASCGSGRTLGAEALRRARSRAAFGRGNCSEVGALAAEAELMLGAAGASCAANASAPGRPELPGG